MVTVTNGHSNRSAVLNISVLRPVSIQHITADPVTLRRPFDLEAVITGDCDISVNVDCGDGNSVNGSTVEFYDNNVTIKQREKQTSCSGCLLEQSAVLILPLNDSSFGSVPVYSLRLRHLYATSGSYVVSLSIGNAVSHVTRMLMAHVTNDDFRVTLTADRQSPVASITYVTIDATVAAADGDVSFSWMSDCCSEMPVVHR